MDFQTSKLHDRFGVRIENVDLRDISDETFPQLRAAFEEHSLLLFPNQEIEDADHMRLARRFGPIEDRYADERAEGEAFEVPAVTNIREDGSLTEEMDLHTLNLKSNMLWHSDSTFLPIPALTNILIGRVVTQTGGQTEFASTRAGWADMPEEMKAQVRDTGLWHR